ncbi:MAG: hypothetical protein DHS20C02_08270 [Micavibrio sp.]|nr:MAG: hypothetical protein DHS20C02_08270 [Micavibrio sp.]
MTLIQRSRFFTVIAILAASASLSACNLYEEGHITENRVQVIEERFVEEVSLEEATPGYISGLARHYEKHGDGTVDLSVTYDPHSRSNTAMNASQSAAGLVKNLRKEGVRNVNADILPLQGYGDESMVVVSYMSYRAEAPKDCGRLSGFEDTDISHDKDYRMGCTVETMFAKQISRPKDLLGVGRVDPTTDGRRAGNIGDLYRSGARNEPLEGETASE